MMMRLRVKSDDLGAVRMMRGVDAVASLGSVRIRKHMPCNTRRCSLQIMLKQTMQKMSIPSIKWFEFVTGLSELEFIGRRSEVIQPHPAQSSNMLHGIDIGQSLQIVYVFIVAFFYTLTDASFSNVETRRALPAGSFASISISELRRAADSAAAAAVASDPNPCMPVVFEIHVRSGSKARQLLHKVEVKRQSQMRRSKVFFRMH